MSDGGNADSRDMYWESTDGATEWWGTDICTDEVGLLFYHFEFDSFGKTSLLTKGDRFDAIIGNGSNWQITVYSAEFSTPDSIKGGIIYQIFPDRFYNSGEIKDGVPADRILRDDWGAVPVWKKNADGEIVNNDYFCGDLKGIEQKLSYIASLGVTCIYLNPIALAHSNHRYDVADYMKIDPLLGTDDDFRSLCEKAREMGILIMIDGVYSHTGSDSVYFNMNKRYGDSGAFNDVRSPYRKWYTFDNREMYGYKCWWNVPTLPEVNETEPSFSDFITGENGVIAHWMNLGASALRLDVADELPDSFLDSVRKRLKSVNSEAFLLGEVWEDASNKISYNSRRRYLLGNQLDSVMNYPFRDAIIEFLLYGSAEDFAYRICSICENYPKPALDSMMNLLGTHDTERILNVLSGIDCNGKNRDEQSRITLSAEQITKGTQLLRIAYTLLFTLPGVPSIYYGDEILTHGCRDPFNRTCFDWTRVNCSFVEYIRELGNIRREYECLIDGDFLCCSATQGCVAYIRKGDYSDSLLVIANMNNHDITYYLFDELSTYSPLLGCSKSDNGVYIPAYSCVVLASQ